MKKIACSVLMLAVATVSAPRKSDAAIVLGTLTGGAGALVVGGGIAGSAVSLGVIGGLLCAVGVTSDEKRVCWLGVGVPALVLLVLDEKSGARPQTEAALAERYPFIEDRTVITDLARAISVKAEATPADQNGFREVRLSRSEITEILAPTDLLDNPASLEQVELLIRDLE